MANLGVTTVLLLVLHFLALTFAHSHGPRETVVAQGVDKDDLPEGGWTGWFNSDGTSGKGDNETIAHIIKRYQTSCSRGFPCKKGSVVVAQARTHLNSIFEDHQRPADTGDDYQLDLNGLLCLNSKQTNGKCHNYEVRFFCKGCDTKFCCMSDTYDQIKRILHLDD